MFGFVEGFPQGKFSEFCHLTHSQVRPLPMRVNMVSSNELWVCFMAVLIKGPNSQEEWHFNYCLLI